MPTGSKPNASAKPTKSYAERQGELVTPGEAADILGVTERMIWRLIYEGKLRPTKVGKLVRIRRSRVLEYIDEHEA